MNLGAASIVIRTRTVSEILDLCCRLTFGQALPLFARLGLWLLLPATALVLGLRHLAALDWLATWTIAVVLASWLEAPFTIAASRLLFDEPLDVRGALRLTMPRLASFTGASLIKAALLGLAALPFFLLLPFVWPNGAFVTEATVLEGATATEAWGRSKRLVAGRTSDAFVALTAILTARIGFVVGIELLGQAVLSDVLQLGHPFGQLLEDGGSPFAVVGLMLSSPFVATARFLSYIDTRTRADGWDLQVKLMAIVTREQERHGRATA